MTAVSFDISMSLDGYIAAPNRRSEEPLGDNGERLHEWAFSSDTVGREVLAGRSWPEAASRPGR